jgi:GTP-binding protein Era
MTSGHSDETGATEGFRAGTVGLCGRPNVGKSSLLNALVGAELAVATRFAQTTRERMLGVWTEPGFQAVLVDTPGIHQARSALNKFMVDEALRGARAVDVLLLLAEVPQLADPAAAEAWQPGPGARAALEALLPIGKPIALVLTKVDRIEPRGLMLPVIAAWSQLHAFAAVLPVSAHSGEGLDALRAYIAGALPVGPPRYDDDRLSDRSMRWHAGERVRAALFRHLGDELPYACAVTVESFKEQKRPPRDIIRASIHVERDSQKAIVVGRGGQTIKAISIDARKAISGLTGRACDLFLNVAVTANWTRDAALMQRLGLHEAVGGES